jgi:crotonobetaine/carnitine-CoA ligase
MRAWRDLWFHSGDLLRQDADGWFYFVDRQKDYIRRRGENISTYEVEQAVAKHPAVLECAVFGLPSAEGEQEVAVSVFVTPGATLDPLELVKFLESQLPYFAIPRFVDVALERLPRTPSGKISKAPLRDRGRAESTWDARAHGYVPPRAPAGRPAPVGAPPGNSSARKGLDR